MKIVKKSAFILMWGIFALIPWRQLNAQNLPATQVKIFDPLQLEARIPFEPTAFPNGQKSYLMYELYLTNYSSSPLTLRCIKVLDATGKTAQPVAVFQPTQLRTMVRFLGRNTPDTSGKLILAGGQCAIVFMEVAADRKMPFPANVIHRVITETDSLDGALISTHHTHLQILGPPLQGPDWTAADGPGNAVDNHHRRGVIIIDGHASDSRRYAIDWKKMKDTVSFSGNKRDVRSYFCYGEKVFAVANGRVVKAQDGLPNNIPGHGAAFHPAVPLTYDVVCGNTIVIDLGNGHFAHYMHLQAGSLRVKAGDYVHKGQLIAHIGASGDAREPHLHFEVTTSPSLLLGEGVPYVIDYYQSSKQVRHNELPRSYEIVDFGKR